MSVRRSSRERKSDNQSLIIAYERNQEKNPNLNKENEKKKHEDELPTSHILKAHFSAALEANTPSSLPRKVFVWTR